MMELHSRIIPNYMNIVRECVQVHDEFATDYDIKNWNDVQELRLYLGKSTLSGKCLLARVVDTLEEGDYEKASQLQLEAQKKINLLLHLYSKYKKNLF